MLKACHDVDGVLTVDCTSLGSVLPFPWFLTFPMHPTLYPNAGNAHSHPAHITGLRITDFHFR